MLQDYIGYVFENFRKRKMRTWLTMIGIFIGIAAVVALVSLGQGLQQFIDEQFEAFGTDKLIIQPKTGFAPPGSDLTTTEITSNDEEVVERTRGVIETTSFILENVKVEFNEQTRFHQLFSIPTDEGKKLYDEINQFEVQDGRDVRKGDKFKVLVGVGFIEDDLFQPNVKVGDKIEINDMEFKVIGHYERIGNSGDDRTLVITEEAMREIFNVGERVDFILARTAKSEKPSNVAVRVEKELRTSRDLEEGKEDFVVQTSEDFIESFQNILLAVQLVLAGIAAISLLVGGIGITNTMYTAVLERTKEIGIMKAIGARNSDILKIFLLESGILGLAGGIIGVALGIGFSKLVEIAVSTTGNTFLKAAFPWYLVTGALLFAFLVGAISGAMPAIRASRLKPVDALRYE